MDQPPCHEGKGGHRAHAAGQERDQVRDRRNWVERERWQNPQKMAGSRETVHDAKAKYGMYVPAMPARCGVMFAMGRWLGHVHVRMCVGLFAVLVGVAVHDEQPALANRPKSQDNEKPSDEDLCPLRKRVDVDGGAKKNHRRRDDRDADPVPRAPHRSAPDRPAPVMDGIREHSGQVVWPG